MRCGLRRCQPSAECDICKAREYASQAAVPRRASNGDSKHSPQVQSPPFMGWRGADAPAIRFNSSMCAEIAKGATGRLRKQMGWMAPAPQRRNAPYCRCQNP